MPLPPKVELRSVCHRFVRTDGSVFTVLDGVDLAVAPGAFVSLIGPSGCGKSTMFNVIAGLLTPSDGVIVINGQDATGTIGRVGYMLQKDLLLPWRTVLDNIILGLEIRGAPVQEARAYALPYLHRYGLGGFEHAYPAALSGGMRQRAALLRTLLFDGEIVLLDEPFGALDAHTRSRMQEWLLQIWQDFRKTVIFITHDVDEAIYLSDVIHVMVARPGRIVETLQVALPRPRPRSIMLTPEFNVAKARCLALIGHDDHADAA